MHILVHMNKKVHMNSESMDIESVDSASLPRREREVMDIVFALERATVSDVQERLADKPSYSATRMLLQRLHKKKLLQANRDGARYVYSAVASKRKSGARALIRLLRTFFGGSATGAVSALLGEEVISDDELEELEALVKEARRSRSGKSPTHTGDT